MEYLNRFKSTVSSVAAQVTQALPGNPIFREYELHKQIGTAGPGLSWKIYSGIKYSTKQTVSIWVFEKKQVEKWPKNEREAFPDLLKKGVSQLTRLRHPRLLIVEHAIEESRDSYAFCTEPIFASLANVFGNIENISPTPEHLREFKLVDIEIRHGLFQLGEALAFLHNDAKMLHGNLCPSSIIINDKGNWKLAGFDFCIAGTTPNGKVTFETSEWDRRVLSIMNPDLDYSAPELVSAIKIDVYADIYSIGVLAYALFNDYKPIFENKNMLDNFNRNTDKLKQLSLSKFANIPDVFREDVKVCLNFTPELRPNATQFTKINYFDDHLIKTLNFLDSLMQMDNTQKMQFFKGLPPLLEKFPKRPLLQKVLPYLTSEFTTPELIPFILPCIFLISEEATNDEFSEIIFPPLIPVFAMNRPYQIVLTMLQKMPLLLQKTPEGDIRKYVLPLVYGAIMNGNMKIQELCLAIIPTIGKLVDRDAMRSQLLPKLLKLALEGTVLSIRVQTLLCIGKLMPHLESWMVTDQILPALPKINSKEPGILMAILGIYKLAYETEKFGIGREQAAKSVLPFLISTCVENTLNLSQFEKYVAMVHLLLEKVEKEQRNKLQQLSASEEEQRTLNFDEILNADASKAQTKAPEFDDLSGILSGSSSPEKQATNNGTRTGKDGLTLEEKKRIAAEQEQNLRLRTQPSVMTSSSTVSTKPSEAKDPFNAVFDSNISLIKSTPKVSPVLKPSGGDIDLSEFLPSSSTSGWGSIAPQSTSSSNAGWPSASSNSAQNSLFSLTPSNTTPNIGFGAFPQPPQASNPVNRPFGQAQVPTQSQMSQMPQFPAMNSGFNTFPSQSQPVMNIGGSSMSLGGGAPAKPQPVKGASAFDDLLSFPLNISKKPSSNGNLQQSNGTTKKNNLDDLLG